MFINLLICVINYINWINHYKIQYRAEIRYSLYVIERPNALSD